MGNRGRHVEHLPAAARLLAPRRRRAERRHDASLLGRALRLGRGARREHVLVPALVRDRQPRGAPRTAPAVGALARDRALLPGEAPPRAGGAGARALLSALPPLLADADPVEPRGVLVDDRGESNPDLRDGSSCAVLGRGVRTFTAPEAGRARFPM